MSLRTLRNKIPTTSGRVPAHTSRAVNEKILEATRARLEKIGHDEALIEARLAELEREWDIERVLEAHAAGVTLLSLSLGATVNRRWFLFPAVVAGFLFQHAVQGWCPPMPVFRRLGVRTAREIEEERTILLARRGDLRNLEYSSGAEALSALHAVR